MREALLTQREFDTWRESDADFKKQMLAHIETQVGINIQTASAIAALEAKQNECADSISRRATWISSIVSAIVGGIVGAFSGRA